MIEFLEFMHTNLWTYFGTMCYTVVVLFMVKEIVKAMKGIVNQFYFYDTEEGAQCTENNN